MRSAGIRDETSSWASHSRVDLVGVVDLQWHPVNSQDCSIQLVDGTPELFDAAGIAARSQFPDRPGFEGPGHPGTRCS